MSASIEIPITPEEITPDWLTQTLRSAGVLGTQAIASLTKTRIGEDEGFTGGALLRCNLTYTSPTKSAPHSLIAKLSPADPGLRDTFRGNNQREVGFYTELAAKSNLPVPGCFFGEFDTDTGASILLLEDLDHYRMVPFATGCAPQDAQYAVQALAAIHAQFWNDPRVEPLSGVGIMDDFPIAKLWSQYPQVVAELLPEFAIPPQFFAIGDIVADQISPLLNYIETTPITCIHRDCHVDNILFSENVGDEPVLILDWQAVGKGRGVYDIAYFVISSVPVEQRRQTERTLLREYHARLKQFGIEDYPFEQCWFDYKVSVIGKFLVTVIATVLVDNSTPFKRAWRQTDLHRLLAFCDDHAVGELLASI